MDQTGDWSEDRKPNGAEHRESLPQADESAVSWLCGREIHQQRKQQRKHGVAAGGI